MSIGFGIDELRGDAYPIARSHHRSFDEHLNIELGRDRRERFVGSLQAHRGVARDHLQLSDFGQVDDERFGHAVRKKLLLGIAAQVRERQDRDRSNRASFWRRRDSSDLFQQLVRAGEPAERLLGQTTPDDGAENPFHRLRVVAENGRQRLRGAVAAERGVPGSAFVENSSERELVGTQIGRLPLRLFGGHVADGAENGTSGGAASRCGGLGAPPVRVPVELGEPKVDDLDVAVSIDEDVLGLQVTVGDAGVMGFREPLGRLPRKADELVLFQATRGELLPQRDALDELHRNVGRAVVLADFIDGHDVGVVQRRCCAGFLLKPTQAFGIGTRLVGEDFDGDFTPELRICRAVDDAHTSRADLAANLVMREFVPRRKRHSAAILRPRLHPEQPPLDDF